MLDEDLSTERVNPPALERFVPLSAERVLVCGDDAGVLSDALERRNGVEVERFLAGPQVGNAPVELVSIPFANDRFECTVAVDLLPRLRDPAPVLRELRRGLSPGGLLIATAPNLQHFRTVFMLADARWSYAEEGILARSHVRFFTGVEVAETLSAARFEVRSLSSLVLAPPERMPRDADAWIGSGRVRVGPLNDTEYQLYRTSQFVSLAVKTGDPAAGG